MRLNTAVITLLPAVALAAELKTFTEPNCGGDLRGEPMDIPSDKCINVEEGDARSFEYLEPETQKLLEVFSGTDCNFRTTITQSVGGCTDIEGGFRSYALLKVNPKSASIGKRQTQPTPQNLGQGIDVGTSSDSNSDSDSDSESDSDFGPNRPFAKRQVVNADDWSDDEDTSGKPPSSRSSGRNDSPAVDPCPTLMTKLFSGTCWKAMGGGLLSAFT